MEMSYKLQENERVIIKDRMVMHVTSALSSYSDDLILTNMNLVLVSKSLFGAVKDITVFKLDDVKIVNGMPRVKVMNVDGHSKGLQVSFTEGDEVFRFYTLPEVNAKAWKIRINNAIADLKHLDLRAAEVHKELSEKESFKDNNPMPKKTVKRKPSVINTKCISCRAPIYGKPGEVVTCEYCDTEQIIEDED